MINENRVCCLYRVSTDKQVDHNSNNEADIPMQRKACHRFAEKMGWVIVHEEQEEGVSGHKVRAENRDKLQTIKEKALKGEFDILLVFMFDRIGRIADETPFVVEWFVKNGIQVWSTQEGEQRFDNHIDKLLNYIRFWQADGESVKTSVRTKTSLGQMVEDGHYKGGNSAYGYDLVKGGRINKKKHELYDLKVNEAEASVVKLVFDKYVNQGYGPQRITTFLNNNGYRTRKGKCWHPATIRGMIQNSTYTGVLRSGESRSELIPELQIITEEQFLAAQEIRKARGHDSEETRSIPLNTVGQTLLSGNVYCGHCGARLFATTNGKYSKQLGGMADNVVRVRYYCYGKVRKQTNCTGQTGYTAHILDDLVDRMVRDIFIRMKKVSRKELAATRFERELYERKTHLSTVESAYRKANEDLQLLKEEIIRALKGDSVFSKDVLANMIKTEEAKCAELLENVQQAEDALRDEEKLQKEINSKLGEMLSWAELYSGADNETKKMIISCLIKRIEVCRDYQLNVEFNFDMNQFLNGLDCSA